MSQESGMKRKLVSGSESSQSGSDPKNEWHRESTCNATVVRNALKQKDLSALRTALRMDRTLANRLLIDGGWKVHPLVYVARDVGSLELVQVLLDHDADVNATAAYGRTALHYAVQRDNLKLVQLLLEHGAEKEARDNDHLTPLYYARTDPMVRLLARNGADMNSRDFFGKSPLMNAVRTGDLARIMLLVEHGADIHAFYPDGLTCLHEATRRRQLEIIDYLLVQGANVNAPTTGGKTSLYHCVEVCNLEVARLLLERGADVHANSLGADRTPFLLACRKDELGLIYCMIRSSLHHRRPQPI